LNDNFLTTTLGNTGLRVHRLGLSASYRPGKKAVYAALDAGINFFFGFGVDTQLTGVMREVLAGERKRCVIATGAYNMIWGYPNLRRSLEKRLRQFGTDYIDIFMFLGVMKEKEFPERAQEELHRMREEGKFGYIGMSCHDRDFAGRMAAKGALDLLMIRYNAAHRRAELDIFPHLALYNPGIVSYTATRWTYLLRRPRQWPKHSALPTPGQCYRFALSHPNVHVCLTAPTNERQLAQNINALREGPLTADEMSFMKDFGDAVHKSKRWFM
jgi:aryl-alcohol dehydrogenase-like predicted oxidoreductase